MAFKEENEESQIQLAAFPYSDIQDDKVKISESDLKAKYDEIKARFKQPVESRDIKFVDIEVQASNADRAALNKEFAGYHSQLSAAADPTEVVRKSASTVAYLGIPVSKEISYIYYNKDLLSRNCLIQYSIVLSRLLLTQ